MFWLFDGTHYLSCINVFPSLFFQICNCVFKWIKHFCLSFLRIKYYDAYKSIATIGGRKAVFICDIWVVLCWYNCFNYIYSVLIVFSSMIMLKHVLKCLLIWWLFGDIWTCNCLQHTIMQVTNCKGKIVDKKRSIF